MLNVCVSTSVSSEILSNWRTVSPPHYFSSTNISSNVSEVVAFIISHPHGSLSRLFSLSLRLSLPSGSRAHTHTYTPLPPPLSKFCLFSLSLTLLLFLLPPTFPLLYLFASLLPSLCFSLLSFFSYSTSLFLCSQFLISLSISLSIFPLPRIVPIYILSHFPLSFTYTSLLHISSLSHYFLSSSPFPTTIL